jgi:hypothetical protein
MFLRPSINGAEGGVAGRWRDPGLPGLRRPAVYPPATAPPPDSVLQRH